MGGGIIENATGQTTIKNCYSIGEAHALTPDNSNVTVTNSYYLKYYTYHTTVSLGEQKEAAYFKTQEFCNLLNGSSSFNVYKMIKEQDTPALYWQEGTLDISR